MLKKIFKNILKNKSVRVIVHLVRSIIKNDFFGMAAEMSFMLIAGFFPFMLFLMAVFGWMGNKSYMEPILRVMSSFMPPQAMGLLKSVLTETMIFDHGTLLAVIGIVVSLVLSTNGIAVILKGLNRAYKLEEKRSVVDTR